MGRHSGRGGRCGGHWVVGVNREFILFAGKEAGWDLFERISDSSACSKARWRYGRLLK